LRHAEILAGVCACDLVCAHTPGVWRWHSIRLRIDEAGALFWGGETLPRHALAPMLRVEASREPQAALQLETAADASYQLFADVLATAHEAGVQKIGFVADP
jgi:biopolymer transport protein ExbD